MPRGNYNVARLAKMNRRQSIWRRAECVPMRDGRFFHDAIAVIIDHRLESQAHVARANALRWAREHGYISEGDAELC